MNSCFYVTTMHLANNLLLAKNSLTNLEQVLVENKFRTKILERE